MANAGTAAADNDVQAADLSSNELELFYARHSDLAHRKKFGQFFTPYSVACFMSQWIAKVSTDNPHVLDPCGGLGVFERAIFDITPAFARKAQFTLWEKDEPLAEDLSKVCERLAISHSVICGNFLDEDAWSAGYDAIIANPPYYKHHHIDNKNEIRTAISTNVGATFSVQTNIYCWFLLKALSLLKPGGRLAFIIPTEFLNANYGTAVKKYLLESGCLRHIVSVCYKSNTFHGVITTACIILAEKEPGSTASIRFYRADSTDQFDDLTRFLGETEFTDYRVSALDTGRKWRSYFPGSRKIATTSAKLVPFSSYGRFSRGIATGANRFFAIRPSTAAERQLPGECLIPCVSKAGQARGKIFTERDFIALEQADKPVYLFDGEASSTEEADRYIRFGEASGYQRRYLTKSRKPWYALEKRSPGKIWVAVFGREGIRFIWNESDAISLTCFHVFQPSRVGRAYLPFLFLYLNSATGRNFLEFEKREYGNGLEKYEPNDINKTLAPDFKRLEERHLQRLAGLQKRFIGTDRNSVDDGKILQEADAIFSPLISNDSRRRI